MQSRKKSQELFSTARHFMPGGVNSPVRACKSVGLDPVLIQKGNGSKLYDLDGNEYIDYVCSWGPLILGHAHPEVVAALCQAARQGTSFGATCEREIELARLICEAIPSIEKVRMVSSGTEATMSAVRLARAYTGRDRIVKFEGCYHGHGDTFLIKAGSGLLTTGVPTSPGVPPATAGQTLIAHYNNLDSVTELFNQFGAEIAAVIVEPVAGNMGLVLPHKGFLEGLRRITQSHGCLLIFDEVITGFRLTYGAYQNIVGVEPDLTTLGKVIGGGMPVGAYGGRQEIMENVSPEGDVYQAGTLSGNPLAMAAGVTTLTLLQHEGCYEQLDKRGALLTNEIKEAFHRKGVSYCLNRIGSMFALFFTEQDVVDYKAVMTCNTALFAKFYTELLCRGVWFPPSQYETCFLSCAHTDSDIEKTINAVDKALDGLK